MFKWLARLIGGRAEASLDTKAFTREVARRFRDTAPHSEVTVTGPLALEFRADAGSSKADLSALHAACLGNPPARDELIANFVATFAPNIVGSFGLLDPSLLRTVVRTEKAVEAFRRGLKIDPAARPLCGPLWMFAVIDRPHTIQTLSHEALEEMNLSLDEALEIGLRNSREWARTRLATLRLDPEAQIGFLIGEAYDSSLMAFPDLWGDLAVETEKLLVAAPGESAVLIDASGREFAEFAMAEAAVKAMDRVERPLCSAVFRWTPDGWRMVLAG